MLNALKIIALDDYKLHITYDTGEVKYINLKNIIFKHDCYKQLRNMDFFRQVFVDDFGNAPCWPDNLNMDPVEIYHMGLIVDIDKQSQKFRKIEVKDYANRVKSYYLLKTDKYTVELEANLTFYEDCVIINFEQVGTEEFFSVPNVERYYVEKHPEALQFIADKFHELLEDKEECDFYAQIHEYCFDIYFVSNRACDINCRLGEDYLDFDMIENIYDC